MTFYSFGISQIATVKCDNVPPIENPIFSQKIKNSTDFQIMNVFEVNRTTISPQIRRRKLERLGWFEVRIRKIHDMGTWIESLNDEAGSSSPQIPQLYP